jgi:hypothetical protein
MATAGARRPVQDWVASWLRHSHGFSMPLLLWHSSYAARESNTVSAGLLGRLTGGRAVGQSRGAERCQWVLGCAGQSCWRCVFGLLRAYTAFLSSLLSHRVFRLAPRQSHGVLDAEIFGFRLASLRSCMPVRWIRRSVGDKSLLARTALTAALLMTSRGRRSVHALSSREMLERLNMVMPCQSRPTHGSPEPMAPGDGHSPHAGGHGEDGLGTRKSRAKLSYRQSD